MQLFRENCHAKLNLYLAVTGRRVDGFHDLVSLVAQVSLHDELTASPSDTGADSLACNDANLSAGQDNLVLKAAAAYRNKVKDAPFLAWHLVKKLPYGAGMGGGSSDAAGALRILNKTCNEALSANELEAVAAEVGSDCPLFLREHPCLMRGRGEILEELPPAAAKALQGRHVAIVKPHFGIPTGWAYGAVDTAGALTKPEDAEGEISRWLANPSAPPPVRNSFMDVVYRKYLCYDALNDILRAKALPEVILTGSGSAAFALTSEAEAREIAAIAQEQFGEGSFAAATTII
jgi:4-diphosphocytidyl-2-C-methyl-D-erythritol kinase